MPRELRNYRDQDGQGAFPNETPFLTALNAGTRRFLTGEIVPMPPVTGPTVLYLDISKWQGTMNFDKALAAGARAVFIKADQGIWTDDKFEQHTQGALDTGLEVGFYHFADPQQSSVTPEAAAQHCYNLTKGIGNLSVVLDAERSGGLVPSALLNYYVRWCQEFRSLDSQRKIELYTRMSFFNASVSRSSFWQDNNINLWAARYHLGLSTPWSDGHYPPLDWPYGLNEYHAWQHSADGNGMGGYFGAQSASIDLNLYNGDWSSFVEYYEIEDTPTDPPCPCQDQINVLTAQVIALSDRLDDHIDYHPDPDPDPVYDTEMIVDGSGSDGLNLRKAPDSNSAKIVNMPEGSKVMITRDGQVSDPKGYNWVKTKYGDFEGWCADGWLAEPKK